MRILQYVKAPSDEAVLRPVSVFLAGGAPENQEENKGKALMELARAEMSCPEAIYAKIKARI